MNSVDNVDKQDALSRGKRHLSGDDAPCDYEQAAYWLELASSDSEEAQALLSDLQSKGLGIECAASSESEDAEDALRHEESCSLYFSGKTIVGKTTSRCVNCGIVGRLVSLSDGLGMVCESCGAVQHLPLSEEGLTCGLALQPYQDDKGVRSFFGAQINALKYDSRLDDAMKRMIMDEVAERIEECDVVARLVPESFRNGLVVVPAPSSKRRTIQPVYEIARLVAGQRFEYRNSLIKHSHVESKSRMAGSELPEGEITCSQGFVGQSVLLIDDTYGEGATARACIKALKGAGAGRIFLLTLCKNMFGGIKAG